jgi:O-antigen/teichoic acid export membrane protein
MKYISSMFGLKTVINNFFNQGDQRSINAKKNILVLSIVKGLSIAISLFIVPITIHYVNPTRYGIWLTLSSMVGWFSFFDIGLGNGLRNKFAEVVAKGDFKMARIYVSTTYAILSIIIALVLILFLCINPFLNWSKLLNAPSDMAGELSLLALIVFVFFCLQFVLRLITTIITANQQPAKASIFELLGTLISVGIIFILTKTTSGNLIYLGTVFSIAPVLVYVSSSIWFYTHQYKQYAPAFKYVKFGYARDLMTLGIKFFIIQIAALLLYSTNNIIIAQLFGPEQVTPFNISYKYFGVVTMAFSILMLPFWSAFTEAWVKKDIQWIKNTVRKLVMIWILIGVGTLIMFIFSDFIFRIWIGKEVKVPIKISAVMAVYVVINAWCAIFSHFLNGVGKIKLQLYSGLLAALINIPLAIFLGKQIGIHGVVLATCLLSIGSAIWSPIQYWKIINNRAAGIWDK